MTRLCVLADVVRAYVASPDSATKTQCCLCPYPRPHPKRGASHNSVTVSPSAAPRDLPAHIHVRTRSARELCDIARERVVVARCAALVHHKLRVVRRYTAYACWA